MWISGVSLYNINASTPLSRLISHIALLADARHVASANIQMRP
jgi:hypothetical protein